MIKQLLLALVLSSATVLIHAGGILYVVLPLAGVWSKKVERRAGVVPVMPSCNARIVFAANESTSPK